MEKIWLATKYYLDDKLVGCSAATERMFTRLLAWVGDNETGGNLPENPHVFVALPSGKPSVLDLVSRGVLIHKTEGGYRFNGWGNWNSQADELAKRRKSDRERKRRERAKRASQSRDESRDVHALDEEEDKDRDKERDLLSDDDSRNVAARDPSSSSSEFADGTPIPEPPAEIETAARPPKPKPSDAARTVVRQELGPGGYPRATTDRLAVQVGKLAHEGIPDDVIREALREWENRSGARPEWLGSIAGDVVQARRSRAPNGHNGKPSKLRGIAELAAAARAEETAHHQQQELLR